MSADDRKNVAFLKEAMSLLYETCIKDREQANQRGVAIRAIDSIIVAIGGVSHIPTMER